MEEEAVLSGDSAFNAHFGECIAAIGDIDDDGYQGQFQLLARDFMSEHVYIYVTSYLLSINFIFNVIDQL